MYSQEAIDAGWEMVNANVKLLSQEQPSKYMRISLSEVGRLFGILGSMKPDEELAKVINDAIDNFNELIERNSKLEKENAFLHKRCSEMEKWFNG